MKKNSDMLDQFVAARRVSVPIVVIRTADQFAVAHKIHATESKKGFPVVQWDAAQGITPISHDEKDIGGAMLKKDSIDGPATVGLLDALIAAQGFQGTSILCCHNAHRQLTSFEPGSVAHNVQAASNLRETYKRDFRTLVLLCPDFVAPPELAHDVVIIDDELPEPADLADIVKSLYAAGGLKKPTKAILEKAVDAVAGLSRFEAEQIVAMSLTKSGLNIDALWDRKRTTISQTPGLKVCRTDVMFDDLVGLDPLKEKLRARGKAKTPIGVVVYIDEIDKALANLEHDTTNVRTDQMKNLLTAMQDNHWRGMCLVGVAGGGKSAVAKALGNEMGVPSIEMDLGAMEAPHVGESEALIRNALKVIDAVGRGNAYFIATSNNHSVMKPELQRRFGDGFWFHDLMSKDQRKACWEMYVTKFKLDDQERPNSEGWTGAEIENCCESAWDMDQTLMEASRFIVPMAQSRADEVEKLRRHAHGRFLDANKAGPYRHTEEATQKIRRGITLPDAPVTVEVSSISTKVGNA